jgi:uncharacterized damage-inducible protein DinB
VQRCEKIVDFNFILHPGILYHQLYPKTYQDLILGNCPGSAGIGIFMKEFVLSISKITTMAINQGFIAELQHEATITRKFLEAYPEDKPNWSPHGKSMKISRLAGHLAEIPNWLPLTLDRPELDFAEFGYEPKNASTVADLLDFYNKNIADALACLERTADAVFMENWTMRRGEHVFFSLPKAVVLRNFIFNHSVHHRAQLGVYLRLLDISVPAAYGNSADTAPVK